MGPGNRWVAEAKRQVVGQVGIDMIAGPTEVLIIADGSARPERVAADLVAQAEHDEDACAWCVTTDEVLADALPAALEAALARAPRAAIARAALERNGVLVVGARRCARRSRSPTCGRRSTWRSSRTGADRIAAAVRHAGAIFLGDDTPEPVGDYLAGPEPRAPHRRHRALRVSAGRLRLRQAHQRHPLQPGRLAADAAADHRAGGGRGAVRPRGGGANPDRTLVFEYDEQRIPARPAGQRPRLPPDRGGEPRRPPTARRRLWWVLVLTGGFMVVEAVGGWVSGSLALLADAGHMLTDVGALGLSLLTAWIARRPADDDKTYGYLRWEILAALVNGAALFGIAGWVVVEAIHRFQRAPRRSGPASSSAVAGGGPGGQPGEPRACCTERTSTASTPAAPTSTCWATLLGSVGALGGRGRGRFTGWTPADPIVSVVLSLLILVGRLAAGAGEHGNPAGGGARARLDARGASGGCWRVRG